MYVDNLLVNSGTLPYDTFPNHDHDATLHVGNTIIADTTFNLDIEITHA